MDYRPEYNRDADDEVFLGSEWGVAEQFIFEWNHIARYCPDLGKDGQWLIWGVEQPGVWSIDRSGEIVKGLCQETCARAEIRHDQAGAFLRNTFIRNALSMAKPSLLVSLSEFDASPWILNTPIGPVNLRTGQIREWVPGEKLMRQTAVAPAFGEEAVLWESHIRTMVRNTEDPAGVARYLKRLVGMSLVGDQDERPHVSPVLCGTGRNGKGSFTDTLRLALGSYAGIGSAKLLTAGEGDHTAEQAGLEGLRFVVLEEVLHLNPSLFKMLTGGGRIRARKMRADDREFDKTWCFFINNNKPIKWRDGDRTSAGLWSRVPTILLGDAIEEGDRDERWSRRLEEEAPAILAWCIEGAMEWLADGGGMAGLKTPECVRSATEDRKDAADPLQIFIEERYESCDGWGCTASSFMKAYTSWCKDSSEPAPGGRNTVYAELRERLNMKVDKGTGGQIRIFGLKERPLSLGMLAEGVLPAENSWN